MEIRIFEENKENWRVIIKYSEHCLIDVEIPKWKEK